MRRVRTQDVPTETAQVEAEASPPSAKRRKLTKTERATRPRYLCFACDVERVGTQFPDYNPSDDCKHLINTCSACLRKWVGIQVDGAEFVAIKAGADGEGAGLGIKCPHAGCEVVMKSTDVRVAAAKKIFAKFEELERKHVAENTPDWRWCLAPGCNAGQIHHRPAPDEQMQISTPVKRPVFAGLWKFVQSQSLTELEMPGLICTCRECGARACTTCDRPWHEGETCEEYQYRIKDRQAEEDKSLRTIVKVTKKCPGCGKPVQKNGGCPSMLCTLCNVRYCWTCVTVMVHGRCGCVRR